MRLGLAQQQSACLACKRSFQKDWNKFFIIKKKKKRPDFSFTRCPYTLITVCCWWLIFFFFKVVFSMRKDESHLGVMTLKFDELSSQFREKKNQKTNYQVSLEVFWLSCVFVVSNHQKKKGILYIQS